MKKATESVKSSIKKAAISQGETASQEVRNKQEKADRNEAYEAIFRLLHVAGDAGLSIIPLRRFAFADVKMADAEFNPLFDQLITEMLGEKTIVQDQHGMFFLAKHDSNTAAQALENAMEMMATLRTVVCRAEGLLLILGEKFANASIHLSFGQHEKAEAEALHFIAMDVSDLLSTISDSAEDALLKLRPLIRGA